MTKNLITALFVVFALAGFSLAQSTGSIKGKVKSSKGKSLADVNVTARADGENVKSVKTDRKGNFRLRGLKPGKYNLVFEKPGFSGGVLYGVLVRRKKTNNLRDRVRLSVDQGTLVLLEASVFSPAGFSVYGAEVTVEAINSDGSTKKVGKGYTSRDGDVLFRFPVGVTKYKVTARGRKSEATKTVEVGEAGIYRTAITLELKESS